MSIKQGNTFWQFTFIVDGGFRNVFGHSEMDPEVSEHDKYVAMVEYLRDSDPSLADAVVLAYTMKPNYPGGAA